MRAAVAARRKLPWRPWKRLCKLSGMPRRYEKALWSYANVTDLEETDEGMRVAIRRSKTDQEGKGEVIAIVRGLVNCPVKAVKNWLQAISITEGSNVPASDKGGAGLGTRG